MLLSNRIRSMAHQLAGYDENTVIGAVSRPTLRARRHVWHAPDLWRSL